MNHVPRSQHAKSPRRATKVLKGEACYEAECLAAVRCGCLSMPSNNAGPASCPGPACSPQQLEEALLRGPKGLPHIRLGARGCTEGARCCCCEGTNCKHASMPAPSQRRPCRSICPGKRAGGHQQLGSAAAPSRAALPATAMTRALRRSCHSWAAASYAATCEPLRRHSSSENSASLQGSMWGIVVVGELAQSAGLGCGMEERAASRCACEWGCATKQPVPWASHLTAWHRPTARCWPAIRHVAQAGPN